MPVLDNKRQAVTPAGRAKDPMPNGVVHIREYVGCMSSELAQLARGQGEDKLACLLELAAEMARR